MISQYTRFDSNAHGEGLDDMLITPQGWGGNFFNRWSRRGKQFQLLPSYQFAERHWLGKHQIRVGLDLNYRAYAGVNTANPIQLLEQDGTLDEQINFLPTTAQSTSDTVRCRVRPGSLDTKSPLDGRCGGALVQRNLWLVRGVRAANSHCVLAGEQRENSHSSRSGLVL